MFTLCLQEVINRRAMKKYNVLCQKDDDTTDVSCPFRDKTSYLFFFPAFWLVRGGVWPESFEFSLQSPMTDLKDSSLSPLLQITSSDMFGHADNVLSENSFQGWMGYKLSTPRVGYFFNCCFIPLKRERQEGPESAGETDRAPASSGLRTAQDSEAPWIKAVWTLSVLALQCDTGLFFLFHFLSVL